MTLRPQKTPKVGAQADAARLASRLIRDNNRLVTITAGDYAMRPKKTP